MRGLTLVGESEKVFFWAYKESPAGKNQLVHQDFRGNTDTAARCRSKDHIWDGQLPGNGDVC